MENETPNQNNAQTSNETQTNQTQQIKTENTVSKAVFDKTASELAELKSKLKELEKNGKSEAELKEMDLKEKDAEIQEKNKQLGELYFKLNEANAKSIVSEAKAKIKLEDGKLFDSMVSALVTDDGELTSKRATAFSKLIMSIYEKGISDVKNHEWAGMSNGIKSGEGGTSREIENYIKKMTSNLPSQEALDKIKNNFR